MSQGHYRVKLRLACKAAPIGLAFAVVPDYLERKQRGCIMTNGTNRILDDIAKLVTDAAGAAQGVRRELETLAKTQAEKMLNSMDLVRREEFEVVREMAAKARAENQALAARIDALEARLGEISLATAEALAAEESPEPKMEKNS